LQWPILLTLGLFPILAVMYFRLAKREEKQIFVAFGKAWEVYAARVPAFIPRFRIQGSGTIGKTV
jgi:methanethiol S-methyltransferase